MKKYKLIRSALFTCIASLALTTTGCSISQKDNLKDAYVAVIDGELKLLEEEKIIGGKIANYKDIITNEKYDIKDIDIKGSFVNYLSSEDISKIKGINLFGDNITTENLMEIKRSLSNKHKNEWNLKDKEELTTNDKEIFIEQYDNLIHSDNLYILDTYYCDIENENNYPLDRYYLVLENDNPINNNLYDKERILFNNNFNQFDSCNFKYYNEEDYLVRIEINYDESDIRNNVIIRNKSKKQAVFNINEFLKNSNKSYSIKELEEIMKDLNNQEIEKISINDIYIFDATKSNIDIIPINYNDSITNLEISDYYIFIKNNNKFDTLSNNDTTYKTNIFINENELINQNKNYIFKTNVNDTNLINLEDFLIKNGLGEYIKEEYSDLELKHIEDGFNEINKNTTRKSALIKNNRNLIEKNKYNQISDSIDDKYVVIVNDEIKIVEKIKKDKYKDIVTNTIYNRQQITEISSLNNLLKEEIKEIEEPNYFFVDEKWMEVYQKIRDKYQTSYTNTPNYKDRYLEIEPTTDKEKRAFYYEYYSTIPSEDIYVLDIFNAERIDFNSPELDKYLLLKQTYNEFNEPNGFELLFKDNYNIYINIGNKHYRISNNKEQNDYYYELTFEENNNILEPLGSFCNKNGLYYPEECTKLELEKISEIINKKEMDKIDSKKIYIFDATVSNIDIIPFNQNKDISTLNINNYYILIQDDEIKNKYSILSTDGELITNDIYIDDDSRLISSNDDFGFITEVDTSYNLMNIYDFLNVKELSSYVSEDYSLNKLENIINCLNEISPSKSKKLN